MLMGEEHRKTTEGGLRKDDQANSHLMNGEPDDLMAAIGRTLLSPSPFPKRDMIND